MTLRKKSKQSLSKIQRDIWVLCRLICSIRDADKEGNVSCYTCFATRLEGSNRQLGHGPWPKASLGAFLKYDLRVLRWQCARCNIFMGGMGGDFYKRLKEELGDEGFRQLERDRQVTVKAIDHYLKLKDEYQVCVDSDKIPKMG